MRDIGLPGQFDFAPKPLLPEGLGGYFSKNLSSSLTGGVRLAGSENLIQRQFLSAFRPGFIRFLSSEPSHVQPEIVDYLEAVSQ